jgi:hypothetical protein
MPRSDGGPACISHVNQRNSPLASILIVELHLVGRTGNPDVVESATRPAAAFSTGTNYVMHGDVTLPYRLGKFAPRCPGD